MKCFYHIALAVISLVSLKAQDQFQAYSFMESHSISQAKLLIAQIQDDSIQALSKKELKLWAVDHLNNEIRVRHTHTSVEKNTPWTETRVSLKIKKHNHTSVLSVARAQRFLQSGNQVDIDHYWKTGSNFYLNGNANLGTNNLYPVWGVGSGLYYTGIDRMELGLGYRFSRFTATRMHMRIASFTCYPKSLYVNIKYFNIKLDDGLSHAFIGETRKYLRNGFGYFLVRAAAGTEVDRFGGNNAALTSNNIGVGLNYRLFPMWGAEVVLSSEQQRIGESLVRRLSTVSISLNYHHGRKK